MNTVETNWQSIKDFITACNSAGRQYSLRYFESNENYYIWIVDGPFSATTIISQENPNDTDLIDFETNYKSTANTNLNQLDTDGASIVRLKAAKKGWSFYALAPEIITSTLSGSLYCKNVSGTDISGITCKIYDDNGDEITTAGIANANLLTCVKTVLDIELPYDFELIGGSLRVHSNPAQDVRIWIIGAPDIPAQYGGSKEFASGINLKFLAPDSSFDVDGRVTKYITYSNTTHSGKIRITIKHPAGTQVNLQAVIHLYRL